MRNLGSRDVFVAAPKSRSSERNFHFDGWDPLDYVTPFGIRLLPCETNVTDWFVYLVQCSDGSLYTGVSTDVVRRLTMHNQGKGARYTRARRPVRLVFVDGRIDKSHALRSEIAIKRMPAVEKRALIAAAGLEDVSPTETVVA